VLAWLRESALLSPERRVARMLGSDVEQPMKRVHPAPLDPYAILAALERQRVAYLVIGTFARVIRGTDEVAAEVEITPSRQPPNLSRLHRAVKDVTRDSALVDAGLINLTIPTEHGGLTLNWEPPGYHRGYTDLRRGASREPIGHGLRPPIASAADLAGMLSALGRSEDQATIHALRRLIRLGA
jgi:hypothetical protein